jgi:hypothetical protein
MTLKPAYKLTLAPPQEGTGGLTSVVSNLDTGALGGTGKVIDTTDQPQASTVVDLTVRLDLDVPADSVTLVIGQVGSFRPQRDGLLKVALGCDGDELTQVITATITGVEPGLTTSRISGQSAAQRLLWSFAENTYEDKTAAEIVRDLAEQAEVDVAETDDGTTFPAYVVDGRRSFYRHMRDLADLCGFDLYINPDGELVFKRFDGGDTAHILEYGKHILKLELLNTPPAARQVEAWGESPGGAQSESDWAWLTKDFSGLKGSSGDGTPRRLLERPALRNRSGAWRAALGEETDVKRAARRGTVTVCGLAAVKLGDGIRLRGLPAPEDTLDGAYQVRSITHHLSKRDGFITVIGFRSIE